MEDVVVEEDVVEEDVVEEDVVEDVVVEDVVVEDVVVEDVVVEDVVVEDAVLEVVLLVLSSQDLPMHSARFQTASLHLFRGLSYRDKQGQSKKALTCNWKCSLKHP